MSIEPPDDLRPWGYAPGHYTCTCIDCPSPFAPDFYGKLSDKRAWRCREHAIAAWENDLANPPVVEASPIDWQARATAAEAKVAVLREALRKLDIELEEHGFSSTGIMRRIVGQALQETANGPD